MKLDDPSRNRERREIIMGIVVIGAVFVDIKGYPDANYIPAGRNSGHVEQVYGGVSRNVVEDIANCELRPTFVSLVDPSAIGSDVVRKLASHKVNTDYVRCVPDGMGTWLAVFDNGGDVVAAISKRPNLLPIGEILDTHGDEIFRNADSVVIEIDMEKEIVKKTMALAEKYGKPVDGMVANMSIALERRDFLKRVSALSATSRRPASCSAPIIPIKHRRKWWRSFPKEPGRPGVPVWWSPWAGRALCIPTGMAARAYALPERWR